MASEGLSFSIRLNYLQYKKNKIHLIQFSVYFPYTFRKNVCALRICLSTSAFDLYVYKTISVMLNVECLVFTL